MPISAVCITLERMKTCKITNKPIDATIFTCLFSTSLDTTALETGDNKDGSWIWKLQQSIAARWIKMDRMDVLGHL